MNVIIAYLETMFSPYPQTPRLLEAKAELQAMMEDAYNGLIASGSSHNEAVGQVITDFGNLDELAPVLGISAEIHPAAAPSADPGAGAGSSAGSSAGSTPGDGQRIAPDPGSTAPPYARQTPAHPPITLEEAERFADAHRRAQPRLAWAVAMFVLSPAPLIALSTLGSSPAIPFGSDIGTLIGLILLFALVAAGVLVLIRRNQELSPFSHIESGAFTRTPQVERWARELSAAASPKRTTALQVGVTMWILAAVPVLAVSLLPVLSEETASTWIGVAVAATLAMVAIGLLVFLPTNWADEVSDTLGRRGSAQPGAEDEEHGLVGAVAAVYWPLLTTVFLAWSFIGDAWDRSWIVWPIGAVLFGAIAAGLGSWEHFRRNRR